MKKFSLMVIAMLCFGAHKSQNAIQFNGTNAYITFGNNTNLGLPQFALECWFKRTGSGNTTTTGSGGITAVPLITKGRGESDGSNVDMNYFLGIRQSDSTLIADFEEGSGGGTPGLNHPIVGVTKLARNVWYHVAVTYDNSTWRLYLNGQLESQLVVSQPVQHLSIQHSAIASALTSNGTAQGFFHGVIDEVRVWNNARTQTQILSTINTAITSPSTGLVARWGLDEGTGTAISSSAGITVNGTVTGSNWSWVNQQAPFNMNAAPNTPTLVVPADLSTCHNLTTKLTMSVSDLNGDSLWVKFYGRKKNKGRDFSIVPVPDTQFYTSLYNGGTNAMYKAQMNWIVNKKDSANIQSIIGLGDCVNDGDSDENDWKRVDTCMKIIETNTTSIMPNGIPFVLSVGNHDQGPTGNGDPALSTTYFNQYFGSLRFSGRNYYGGHYGTNNDNSYQLFSASGIDFLVISLEWDPNNTYPTVLTWMQNLITSYPNRKVIVASHYILNEDGTFGSQGQRIYNAIKAYPNVFLTLSGHVSSNGGGESNRTDVYNGNTIHSVMSDYQSYVNGGAGWLRSMTLRPSQNSIDIYTINPYTNQTRTGPKSRFALNYDFGSVYTVIDSVKVASGQSASINWNNLVNATEYEWYAKVSDSASVVKSQTYTLKTKAYIVKLPVDVTTCGSYTAIPLSGITPSLSFLWMNGASTSSINVAATGSVSVNVTDSLNCVSKDTMQVIINTAPLQPGAISGTANACLGTQQNFSILAVSSATAYSWMLPGGWSGASAGNTVLATLGSASGTVFVSAVNACGSSPTRSLQVSVGTIPLTPAVISGTTNVCSGAGLILYSIVPVADATNYAWSLPGTWTGTNTLNSLSVTPGAAGGTLSVAASNSCGTSSSRTLQVTVNPLPAVSAISSPTSGIVCFGETLTLSGSGANTYNWTGGITNGSSFTLSAGQTYTVTGTDANGCQNTAVQIITVNALPQLTVASLPANATVCEGKTLNLTASGATTYTWSGTIANGVTFTPLASTVYTVTGTDNNNCANTLTQSITVNTLPVVSISGTTALCIGETVKLTAAGAQTYLWNTSATSTVLSVSPATNTTYIVTGTDANGCENSSSKVIAVNPLPIVSIAGNMELCTGQTTTITANGAPGYSWSNGTVGSELVMAPKVGYNYMVTGTDANGCKGFAWTSFTINSLPVITASSSSSLICVGESATLTVSGGATYVWNTNATGSSLAISPVTSETYSVTGTSAKNCSGSASIMQSVSECTGIESLGLEKAMLIYPNPSKGIFTIELNAEGNFNAEVFNTLGERVYSSKLETGHNTIRLNESKGIYFYVILKDAKVAETGKLVIE